MPTVRIGLDTMGADFSPANEVGGALEAAAELHDRVKVVLFGRKAEILEALGSSAAASRFEIVDASEVITMEDEPVAALKQKRDSSLIRGLMALKGGEIDAFVSI